MGWLDQFFETSNAKDLDSEYSLSLSKAEAALQGLPERDARYIACVAFLMARVGQVDSVISADEKEKIIEVLCTQMKLARPLAEVSVQVSIESVHMRSVELHIIMRRLNELATRDQKFEILRALFHVASSDRVSEAESDEIGQIASGLFLTRNDFISLRSEFREHLNILSQK